MRFAFVSLEGTSLSYWSRLKDEGHDVKVFIKPRLQKQVGDGIVSKANSFTELVAWAHEKPSVVVFDSSGEGEKAEALRKQGLLVMGGSQFCDRLESKREWGEQFAKTLGIKVPETHPFDTISSTIAWLKSHDDGRTWYFKSDKYIDASTTFGGPADEIIYWLENLRGKAGDRIKNIIQEKIDGIAISTGMWFNGTEFLDPVEGTIEHKKFMDGEIGGSTGCSLNVLWFYEKYPKIAERLHFREFAPLFRKFGASPGIYDINAVINKKDGQPYFLEWTPRFGYDSEPTAQRLLHGDLGQFFYGLAAGKAPESPFSTSECAFGVRLSVSPYPFEHLDDVDLKKTCIGTPVRGIDGLWKDHFVAYGIGLDERGETVMKDPWGLVGIATAVGGDLEEMNEEVLDFIKDDLNIPNLQYRTDADKVLSKDIEELRKVGYPTHPAIEGAKV